jgi:hypothetical protein
MAKNNALKDTDLIQKDPFNNAIEGANKLLVVVDSLKGSIKELANDQKNIIKLFDPKDAESLKRFSSELDKAKQTTDAYNSALATEAQVKIQLSKLQQQEAKTTAEITRTTRVQTNEIAKQNKELQAQLASENKAIEAKRKLNSLYLQERKLRNDVGNEIRDLTLAGKAETEQVKKLRVEFEGLDKRIRGVDESLGRYTDTVGNYPQQLRLMQIELQKLDAGSDEFKSLAKEAGVLKDKINDAKDATKAFASGSKFQQGGNLFGQIKNDLLDLDFGGASDKAKQLASVVKSITVGEAVQGVKDLASTFLNLGKSLLLNPIFLVGTALSGIGYYVYTIYENYKLANAESKNLSSSIEDTSNKIIALERKQQELLIKRLVLNEKISKERGDQLLRELDYNKAYKDNANDLAVTLTELAKKRGIEDKDRSKSLNQFITTNQQASIFEVSNFKAYLFERNVAFQNFVNKRKVISQEQKINEDTIVTEVKISQQNQVKLEKETSKQLIENKQDEYARLNSLYEQYLTAQKNIKQAEAELITINQKILQDNTDFEIKQQEKLGTATEAKIRTLFATKGIDLAEKNTNKIREIENTRYSEQVEQDTEIRNAKLLEQEQLYTQSSILLEQDKQAELDKLKNSEVDKQKAKDAEILANKKKLANETIDIAKQTVDQIVNEIKREGDLRNKSFDEQISAREKNITRQQELADKGSKNTLAFEKEQLVNYKLAKAEAEKSELRKLNTIAFIQEFTALLKDNPKTALPKAIVNAGIRKVIQASFIDGTENVGKDSQMKGYKAHNGIDGYHAPVIAFDGNERILNPKHNAMIGAMSNLELAKLAYNYQHGSLATNNIVVQSDGKMAVNIEKMTNEIVALNKAMQSKQGDTINWDSQNQFVINSVQNGMQKVIKQQIQAPRL